MIRILAALALVLPSLGHAETMRMAVVKAGVVLREPCGGRQA